MADKLLQENGTDRYLLEDGSGVLLLETPPVAFDATANITGASTASLSWLHTCTGTNRVLLVDVAVGTSAGGDTKTISATYAGVAMTSLGKRHTADQTSGFVERFALIAPATGLNTVNVTLNSSATSVIGASQSFANADQTLANYTTVTNVSVSGAGSTAATVTAVTPPTGSMVMGGHGAGSPWSAVGNTSRYNITNSSSTGCGNLTGNTAVGAGSNIAMTSTVSTADWWVSFATTIPPVPDATGQTATASQATETDTAGALASAKLAAVARSVEASTAGVITPGKRRAISAAVDTSTATAVARLKRRAVAVATEADTATAVTRAKRRTLVQASETDTGAAMTRRKLRAVGAAAETDTGRVVTGVLSGGPTPLNRATEADTAATAARSKALGVSRAVETDSGTPVTPRKLRAVQAATEADTATAVTRAKRRTLVQASETDTATSAARRKLRLLAAATEADTAAGIVRPGQVSRATELDTATAPVRRKTRVVGQASETDTGGGLVRRIKTAVVARAAELATASALFRRKLKTLSVATSVESARPVGRSKTRPVARGIETDTATKVAGAGQLAILVAAQETDTAYPITYRLVTPRPAGDVTTVPDLGSVTRPGGAVTLPGATGVTPRPTGATTYPT